MAKTHSSDVKDFGLFARRQGKHKKDVSAKAVIKFVGAKPTIKQFVASLHACGDMAAIYALLQLLQGACARTPG